MERVNIIEQKIEKLRLDSNLSRLARALEPRVKRKSKILNPNGISRGNGHTMIAIMIAAQDQVKDL